MVARPKPKAAGAKLKAGTGEKRPPEPETDASGECIEGKPEGEPIGQQNSGGPDRTESGPKETDLTETDPTETDPTETSPRDSDPTEPDIGDSVDIGQPERFEQESAQDLSVELNTSLDEVLDMLAQEVERLQVALEYYRLSDHADKEQLIRWHVQQIDARQDRLEDIKNLILSRGDTPVH